MSGFSLMSGANMAIALITYLRFAEIASVFGTTWKTDAFVMAMVLPILARNIVAYTFGSSFMPIFSRVSLNKGAEAANRFTSRIISWIGMIGLLTVGVLIMTSRTMVSLTGPGLEASAMNLSASMLRIVSPMILLTGVTGIMDAFLAFNKRYGLVAIIRLFEILTAYIIVLTCSGMLDIRVLPVSVVGGALVSFILSLTFAFRLRYRFTFTPNPREENFIQFIRLSIPVAVGTFAGYFAPIVDKLLASYLRESSVTAIDYANRIKTMVMAIMMQPLVTLANVSLSKAAARKDRQLLRTEITTNLNWTSFMLVPTAAFITVLAIPLVSILFQRGEFSIEDSRYVGYAMTFYAPWIAQFGFGMIIARVFYAMKDTMTPVLLSIWGMLVNVLLNIILIGSMGIGGLALATTLASTSKTVLMVHFLRKKIGRIGTRGLIREQFRIVGASLAVIGIVLLMREILPFSSDSGLISRILKMGIYTCAGAVTYFAVLSAFASTQLRSIVERFRNRRTD